MKQTKQKNGFFLEVLRTGYTGIGTATDGEICYSTWCERCGKKVQLVSRTQMNQRSGATERLHAQFIFDGNLLVCANYLETRMKN